MKSKVCVVTLPSTWRSNVQLKAYIQNKLQLCPVTSELFILPQTFFTGYKIDPAYLAELQNGPTTSFLYNSSIQLNASIVCALTIVNNSIYTINSYAFPNIVPLQQLQFYLASKTKFEKIEFFAQKQHVFKVLKTLILVCCDVRRPTSFYSDEEIDQLIYIGNWPPMNQSNWKIMLQSHCKENQCSVLGCCRIEDNGIIEEIIEWKGESGEENSGKLYGTGFVLF